MEKEKEQVENLFENQMDSVERERKEIGEVGGGYFTNKD